MTQSLITSIGYRNALRVNGSLIFALLAIGTCMAISRYPPPNPKGGSSLAIFDRALMTWKYFFIVVFSFLVPFGYVAPFFLTPTYATVIGVDASMGASLVSIMSAANAVCRISLGFVGDRYGRLNTLFIFTLCSGKFDLSLCHLGIHATISDLFRMQASLQWWFGSFQILLDLLSLTASSLVSLVVDLCHFCLLSLQILLALNISRKVSALRIWWPCLAVSIRDSCMCFRDSFDSHNLYQIFLAPLFLVSFKPNLDGLLQSNFLVQWQLLLLWALLVLVCLWVGRCSRRFKRLKLLFVYYTFLYHSLPFYIPQPFSSFLVHICSHCILVHHIKLRHNYIEY